jgi:predicted nucleic acid-binding protein
MVPENSLLLLDSAPIIFIGERHPEFAPRFRPLFTAQAEGRLRFAITPITVVEVLTGPLQNGNEALASRYRATLETWLLVETTLDIAESAARLRASHKLKLPDAIQAASALAISAAALVTHDRDFSRVKALRIIT